MKVVTLTRVFEYNGVKLPDVGAHLTPEQVKDVYAATYPDITSAQIEGPESKGGKLVYVFRRAVGTKGALEITIVQRDGLLFVVPATPRQTALLAKLRDTLKNLGLQFDRILGLPRMG